MIVHSYLRQDAFASESYWIDCGTESAVIDPSAPYHSVVEAIDADLPPIRHILLTHAHFDHFLELWDWVQNTNADVRIGASDLAKLRDPQTNCSRLFLRRDLSYSGDVIPVSDGDVFTIGNATVSVLQTPGHTDGCVTYVFERAAFVGDLVFADGSMGRTDLYGGDPACMIPSIKKVLRLPLETAIYPGHGCSTNVLKLWEIFSKQRTTL